VGERGERWVRDKEENDRRERRRLREKVVKKQRLGG
jgi:hypothetical protein